MSDNLSEVNHQLQQTLDDIKNVVTAASATIDAAQRSGDEEKAKAAFGNAQNGSKEALSDFFQTLSSREEKIKADASDERSASARIKQIVRTFQDGLGTLKKEVIDRYPEKAEPFVSQLEDLGKQLESFLDGIGKAVDEEKEVKNQKKLIQKTLKDLKENLK